MRIEIAVLHGGGEVIRSVSNQEEAMLCLDWEYRQDDKILITADRGGAHLWIRPDAAIAESAVYVPSGNHSIPPHVSFKDFSDIIALVKKAGAY